MNNLLEPLVDSTPRSPQVEGNPQVGRIEKHAGIDGSFGNPGSTHLLRLTVVCTIFYRGFSTIQTVVGWLGFLNHQQYEWIFFSPKAVGLSLVFSGAFTTETAGKNIQYVYLEPKWGPLF